MDSRILTAITLMEQTLSRNLTEKDLAKRVGLTPQHFCVLFNCETREAPKQRYKRLRMEKARELLASDDTSSLSVKEVAARVGCSDLSHFVRDFERQFGLSPKRYRQSKGAQV